MTESEELELLTLQAQAAKAAKTKAAPAPEPDKPTLSPSAERWVNDSFGKRDKISENIGQFLAGAGDAGIKGYLGLKSFLPGGLSEDDKSVLARMKEDAAVDSGWRTAGEVGGNLAATAIPGSALAKAVGVASKVPAGANALVKTLSSLAPAGVTSGATELVLSPSEKEDILGRLGEKGKHALEATLTGMGLSAGGQALVKGATGMFTPTAEAVKLMSEGVVPKLQEGAGTVGKWIGKLTAGASGTERQDKEVVQAFVNRITPGVETKDMTTSELVNTTKQVLQNEFDKITRGKPLVNGKPQLSPADYQKISDLQDKSDLYQILQKAAGTMEGQKGLDATSLVRAARDIHGEKAIAEASYPAADLLEPANRIIGEAGNQQSSRTGLAGFKRFIPLITGGAAAATLPSAAVKLAPLYGISGLGQTGVGARALFGETGTQKTLKKALEALGPYLAASGADPNFGE